MIKKFLKAIIMGLVNSEDLKNALKMLVIAGWLPVLVVLIFAMFKIEFTTDEMKAIVISSLFSSIFISAFFIHCFDAMKYQEEHNCDYKTAWKATE